MKDRSNAPDIKHETPDYSYVPAITTVAMPFLFGKRKNQQTAVESPQEKLLKPKEKNKSLKTAKYEVSNNSVKFFAAKGFPKKQWVLIKEIPVNEIASVESFGNELSITWNGAVYSFVFNKKTESFSVLRDQIRGLLENQLKVVESSDQTGLRRSDFAGLINGSMGVVDLLFDVLMGLHARRVNWAGLEGCADRLGGTWSFTGQTLAPLNLDFSGVSAAVKRQVPKETARESFAVLKVIYGYFEGLKPQEDMDKSGFNVPNVRAVILAYYMLNDLLLAKVIGERDSIKVNSALEGMLLRLAGESSVKVDFGELRAAMDKLGVGVDDESAVGESRGVFRVVVEAALSV